MPLFLSFVGGGETTKMSVKAQTTLVGKTHARTRWLSSFFLSFCLFLSVCVPSSSSPVPHTHLLLTLTATRRFETTAPTSLNVNPSTTYQPRTPHPHANCPH